MSNHIVLGGDDIVVHRPAAPFSGDLEEVSGEEREVDTDSEEEVRVERNSAAGLQENVTHRRPTNLGGSRWRRHTGGGIGHNGEEILNLDMASGPYGDGLLDITSDQRQLGLDSLDELTTGSTRLSWTGLVNVRRQLEEDLIRNRRTLVDLETEKSIFEENYSKKRTEVLEEHRDGLALVESVNMEVHDLEMKKERLALAVMRLENQSAEASILLTEKSLAMSKINRSVEQQQDRLRELMATEGEQSGKLGKGTPAEVNPEPVEKPMTGDTVARSSIEKGYVPPSEIDSKVGPSQGKTALEIKSADQLVFINRVVDQINQSLEAKWPSMGKPLVVETEELSTSDSEVEVSVRSRRGDYHRDGATPSRSTVPGQATHPVGRGRSDRTDGLPPPRRSHVPGRDPGMSAPRVRSNGLSSVVDQFQETPLPARRRSTMLPQDVKIYERNPAITGLGLDAAPSSSSHSELISWASRRSDMLSSIDRSSMSAKKYAIRPKPYDGSIPWKKWLDRFVEDMRTNEWDEIDSIGALRQALRDGPGENAVLSFDKYGDGTLKGLIEAATWACGSIYGADPATELEGRKQKKGESYRQFGMDLRRLANEAFKSMSPSDPWLVKKLACRFIDGLQDDMLASELAHLWRTDMSLNDLFLLADDCICKRTLLRTKAINVSAVKSRREPVNNSDWEPDSSPSETESVKVAYSHTSNKKGKGRGRAALNKRVRLRLNLL